MIFQYYYYDPTAYLLGGLIGIVIGVVIITAILALFLKIGMKITSIPYEKYTQLMKTMFKHTLVVIILNIALELFTLNSDEIVSAIVGIVGYILGIIILSKWIGHDYQSLPKESFSAALFTFGVRIIIVDVFSLMFASLVDLGIVASVTLPFVLDFIVAFIMIAVGFFLRNQGPSFPLNHYESESNNPRSYGVFDDPVDNSVTLSAPMVKCAICNHLNPPKAIYCQQCGNRTDASNMQSSTVNQLSPIIAQAPAKICPQCDWQGISGTKSCPKCGNALLLNIHPTFNRNAWNI
jgi:hypothetical protein